MNELLSSKQVAQMLGVNESSVKRWADSNYLKCIKTPGGHRKFSILDVNEFISNRKHDSIHEFPEHPDISNNTEFLDKIKSKDFRWLAEQFYIHLISANRDKIFEFLKSAHIHHLSLTTIFDQILQPALYKIGVNWEHNVITVDQEHQASAALFSCLVRLNNETVKKPSNGKTAVLAVIENDYHELPLKCLKLLIENEGWTVIYLGANVPFFSIDSAVKKYRPELTLISSTLRVQDQSEIEDRLLNLKMYLKSHQGFLIVGGNGLSQNKLISNSVDHWGKNFTDTMEFIKKIT